MSSSRSLSIQRPIVAAFDFDGTLTTRDSLLSFLIYATSPWAAFKNLAALSPTLLAYCTRLLSRQQTKEKVLSSFFEGMPVGYIQKIGEAFSRSKELDKILRKEAMERLNWHLQQEHRCILVSASVDLYLDPWRKHHGFHDLISSEVEVSSTGYITGRLRGLNCWGPEKTRRLQEMLGCRSDYILYAYGDSRGDKELLAYADYPYFQKMQ